MAVETTNAFSGPFLPNGATTVFPFDFTAPSAEEVAVMLRSASGAESFPTDFGVTINPGSGGTVTFLNPPAAGSELYILLDPDFRQQIGFENGSGWLAEPVNEIADRSAARDQVLKREIGRSILAPLGEGAMTMPPAADRAGKFLSFLVDGGILMSSGTGADSGLREDLVSSGAAMTGNQLPIGEDLRTQPVSDWINNNVLQPSQFAGTPEEQLVRAIAEAGTARNGALGQTVQIPRGIIETTVPFNMLNRAAVRGVSKRGSIIKAAAGFAGDYMATVLNGVTSTFDNGFEHLTLDCNDIAGLGGVDSQAWQEGGGIRNVLLLGFRTHGLRLRDGFGGASTCLIRECEIFGGGVGGPAISGIRVEEISLVGNFLCRVCDTTITGRPGVPMTYGIEIVNDSLHCYAVHFEEVASAIYLDGVGNHVLIGVTGANTVTNLVEIAPTFTGSLTMIGCFRGGATNLLKDNRAGGFGNVQLDRDIRIDARPPIALGSIMAGGVLNGATVTLTKGFGLASVVRTASVPAGSYDLTLTTTALTANDWAPFASSSGFEGNVRCTNLGVNSVRIETFNAAGALTDVNQVKFQVMRVG